METEPEMETEEKRTRITQKRVDAFLEHLAYQEEWRHDHGVPNDPESNVSMCWFLKADGAYLANTEEATKLIKWFIKKGITEHLQNQNNVAGNAVNLGFCPRNRKWYGWSHIAVGGFTIGSTCKPGDVHYMPGDADEFMANLIRHYSEQFKGVAAVMARGGKEKGVFVSWAPQDWEKTTEEKEPITAEFCLFPEKWGRGTWTAETMKDAKQMAKDFAWSIS